MKAGDIVRMASAGGCLVFGRSPDDLGLVVSFSSGGSPIILWGSGMSLFARPDFLEVISEDW